MKSQKLKKNKPNFLWVMDPWSTVFPHWDTTPRLMEACLNLGIKNSWCAFNTVHLNSTKTWVKAQKILSIQNDRKTIEDFRFSALKTEPLSKFTHVFYRVDPPVDLHYMHPLQLLQFGMDFKKQKLIGAAESLLTINEKFEGAKFKKAFPKTLVGAQWEDHKTFGLTQKTTVIKPLELFASQGIVKLDWTQKTLSENYTYLEKVTHGFNRPVLSQAFLKKIYKGEKRLWFVQGQLLAYAQKIPKKGEFKIDMDNGGTVAPCKLSASELKLGREIGKHLKSISIQLASVDLIDGKVTDFNITSPGLLVHIEKILKRPLAEKAIELLLE